MTAPPSDVLVLEEDGSDIKLFAQAWQRGFLSAVKVGARLYWRAGPGFWGSGPARMEAKIIKLSLEDTTKLYGRMINGQVVNNFSGDQATVSRAIVNPPISFDRHVNMYGGQDIVTSARSLLAMDGASGAGFVYFRLHSFIKFLNRHSDEALDYLDRLTLEPGATQSAVCRLLIERVRCSVAKRGHRKQENLIAKPSMTRTQPFNSMASQSSQSPAYFHNSSQPNDPSSMLG
ncbi:MAG: hypothetical protein J3Q66DRAFT_421666 [Benniella sp.]|nr:MAG: hypothetical protein J3Q66DRAFT_421666 [Benniella sp.]